MLIFRGMRATALALLRRVVSTRLLLVLCAQMWAPAASGARVRQGPSGPRRRLPRRNCCLPRPPARFDPVGLRHAHQPLPRGGRGVRQRPHCPGVHCDGRLWIAGRWVGVLWFWEACCAGGVRCDDDADAGGTPQRAGCLPGAHDTLERQGRRCGCARRRRHNWLGPRASGL